MVQKRLILPLVRSFLYDRLVVLAENWPLEPFLFPTQRSILDQSLVPCLQDFSNAGKLRYCKRTIVYREADNDADETKDQPPRRGKEEDSPRGKIVKPEISKSTR